MPIELPDQETATQQLADELVRLRRRNDPYKDVKGPGGTTKYPLLIALAEEWDTTHPRLQQKVKLLVKTAIEKTDYDDDWQRALRFDYAIDLTAAYSRRRQEAARAVEAHSIGVYSDTWQRPMAESLASAILLVAVNESSASSGDVPADGSGGSDIELLNQAGRYVTPIEHKVYVLWEAAVELLYAVVGTLRTHEVAHWEPIPTPDPSDAEPDDIDLTTLRNCYVRFVGESLHCLGDQTRRDARIPPWLEERLLPPLYQRLIDASWAIGMIRDYTAEELETIALRGDVSVDIVAGLNGWGDLDPNFDAWYIALRDEPRPSPHQQFLKHLAAASSEISRLLAVSLRATSDRLVTENPKVMIAGYKTLHSLHRRYQLPEPTQAVRSLIFGDPYVFGATDDELQIAAVYLDASEMPKPDDD